MPTLSVKENFMRVMNGQTPEYIPTYNMMWGMGGMLPQMMGVRNPDGSGKDIWGVEYEMPSGTLEIANPNTKGEFLLKDITKWRDVIKKPDIVITDSEWEALAKEANDHRDPNLPFAVMGGLGPFQQLMGLMGFTEGLSACFEEPEEVKELLNFMADFYDPITKNLVHYHKPDFGAFGDDIAHERNPFVSLEMFRDIFGPIWKRTYDIYNEAGIPSTHHNCGHFQPLLDDLYNMGCTFWEPVQGSNDIAEIREKYGIKMALCSGGIEALRLPFDITEEEVRQMMRDYIDVAAKDGGWCIFEFDPTFGVPSFTDINNKHVNWIYDEFLKVQYTYYN